jgi:hypothetical protein
MEALRSSETSVTCRNMQRYITKESTFHKHLSENHISTSFRLTAAFNNVISIHQLEKLKKKAKLSMCLIKRCDINTYGGEKV